MGKLDSLSRCSVEQKYRMNAHVFKEGQLMDIENDNVGEEEDAEDVELAGIDMAMWEKKNRL